MALQGNGIVGTGFPGDFAQAHSVDPVGGNSLSAAEIRATLVARHPEPVDELRDEQLALLRDNNVLALNHKGERGGVGFFD